MKKRIFGLASCFIAAVLGPGAAGGETLAVRHAEGLVRGFLVLRSLDGAVLASGDLIQTTRGDRVISRLVFYFRDGSLQEETAVFCQTGTFRLLSDHLVQRGPAFPRTIDVAIDVPAGRVRIRSRENGGEKREEKEEKIIDEAMAFPADLANGMTLTLLKNVPSETLSMTLSMIIATPKPRLVKLVVSRAGKGPFSVGGSRHEATRFDARIEIGGIAGLAARLLGKQPHDTSVWILEGEAPGFVKSEGPFFEGSPIWRIELASPAWPG